jgi:4-amino-4-deoxy-L-arabinose transferase-like glycosyltransferase
MLHIMKQYQYGALFIILFAYTIFSLTYLFYVPLWAPPDEIRHFNYCEYIAKNMQLPFIDLNNREGHVTQVIHPPLYYMIGSLLCNNAEKPVYEIVTINSGPNEPIFVHPDSELRFPFSGKARDAYLIRCLSLLCGALSVIFVYVLFSKLFPYNTSGAVLATVFTATLPQHLHITASVSNEPLSTCIAGLYLLVLSSLFLEGLTWRKSFTAGVILGLGIITKTSFLLYIPATIVILLWRNGNFMVSLKYILSILFVCGLVSAWWYLRNWIYYDDPFFSKAIEYLQPWSLRDEQITLQHIIKQTFISFFGYFGSMQFSIKNYHISIYFLLVLFSITGLIKICVNKRQSKSALQSLVFISVILGGGVVFFIISNERYSMFMGRYLFVVMSPIAIAFSIGIQSFVSQKMRRLSSTIVIIILFAISIDVFISVVKPAYAKLPVKSLINQKSFCCTSREHKNITCIRQTFLSPYENLCGISVIFYGQGNVLKTVFSIYDKTDIADAIYTSVITIPHEEPFVKCYIFFPPLQFSKNKEYTVQFDLPDDQGEHSISLWYERHDAYKKGVLMFDGSIVKGDLFFEAYYSISRKIIKDDWLKGKRITIKTKSYLSFRELQLYNEMSYEFRKKTVIYEKMQQTQAGFEFLNIYDKVN